MGDNNRTFFQKLRDNPDIARGELEKTCQSLRSASASDLAERWKKVLTDAEREAMRGGLGEYLAYSMRQALAPGSHASPSSR